MLKSPLKSTSLSNLALICDMPEDGQLTHSGRLKITPETQEAQWPLTAILCSWYKKDTNSFSCYRAVCEAPTSLWAPVTFSNELGKSSYTHTSQMEAVTKTALGAAGVGLSHYNKTFLSRLTIISHVESSLRRSIASDWFLTSDLFWSLDSN